MINASFWTNATLGQFKSLVIFWNLEDPVLVQTLSSYYKRKITYHHLY